MKFTKAEKEKWDFIIDNDDDIPEKIRNSKKGRSLLRLTIRLGERLIKEKDFTEDQVKKIGKKFFMKHFTKTCILKKKNGIERAFEDSEKIFTES